ncbi:MULTISPECIES: Zn-ribbon domain-containing OB-fold protein [unclassified Blastococcus]
MAQRLVPAQVVREGPDGPRLVGSRCGDCAAVAFPAQRSCPRCTGEATEEHLLAPSGTLWGFTVQGFPPKEPYLAAAAPFRPFGVGYVDLAGEVLVESRLQATSPDDLRIGMPMDLVVVPFHVTDAGEELLTYAFAPAGAAEEDTRA